MQSLQQAFKKVGIQPKSQQQIWDENYLSQPGYQLINCINPIDGNKLDVKAERTHVLKIRDIIVRAEIRKGNEPDYRDCFIQALRYLKSQWQKGVREEAIKKGYISKKATVQIWEAQD